MVVLRQLQRSDPSLRKSLVLLEEEWLGLGQNKIAPREYERIHLYSHVSHIRLQHVQLLL